MDGRGTTEAAEEQGPADPAPPRQRPEATSFLDVYQRLFARQVMWYLVVRVAVALVCLTTLLVYEEGSWKIFAGAHVTLIAAVALASLQLALAQKSRDLERLALSAICIDVVIESVLTYLTGGVYNLGFAFLFFASILAAVLLLSEFAGYAVALAATVVLAATAGAYGWAAKDPSVTLPLVHPEIVRLGELRWGRAVANLIYAGAGLFGVAFLTARLPWRLGHSAIVYEEVVERMAEGVVVIDRRGHLQLANAEARHLLSWEHLAGLAGRRFSEALRRDADRRVLEALARGVSGTMELDLQIRDRGQVPVEIRTTPVLDGRGRVRGVVGILRDLSQRRRLEEVQARLARLADTEVMALGIAHEIRNPLGSVRGAVQELRSRALPDPDDQRLAEIVLEESARLDRILQQFLDFARMRPPERRRLDLRALIGEVALLLAQRDDAADVTIDLPPAAPVWVEGDPDLLRQAVINVANNALDALGGRGRLEMRLAPTTLPARATGPVAALQEVPGVALTLLNDGPPIAPELARRIFTPFFTTKRGGLGLGMAITHKILREHDGDLTCEPTGPLGGPAFHLSLPKVAAAREPEGSS